MWNLPVDLWAVDFFLYHLRRKTYWSTIQFINQYLNFYLPLRSLIRSIWYNFASTQMSCILKIVHVQWVTVMIELCIKMQLKNAVKCSLLVLPQSGSLPARKSGIWDLALIFSALKNLIVPLIAMNWSLMIIACLQVSISLPPSDWRRLQPSFLTRLIS